MHRIGWLIVPVLLAALLGIAVFATRGPASATAFTLRPGDCFDVPRDAQVGDIATLDCGTPHDAEVFAAGSLADAAPAGATEYPGADAISAWVGSQCGAAAITVYAGAASQTALAVGYFFPDQTAWDRGERQVTCYLHARDGSKLTAPLATSAPSTSAGS